MTSEHIAKFFKIVFILAFFTYLFGPLLIMGATAFNSSEFPRVSPWECFSVEWFEVLSNDKDLITGLKNSFLISFGVILLAVPLGLAGAIVLTQVSSRVRPWYYTIAISPILIPGVVLGISTLVFWDRLGRMFNAGYDSIFYDGIFLTIIGQSTFVAAYAMLIFISRLQRFDTVQEEAALDLGASNIQTFRKILLPFLAPAIGSAAVLGFLASFENYNTTVFTIISDSTLTTVLASKVRYGINPSISALAVIIILITLFAAILFEILKRREDQYNKDVQMILDKGSNDRAQRASIVANPMLIMTLLIFAAGIGTLYFKGTIGVGECKAQVQALKKADTAKKVEAFKAKRKLMLEQQEKANQIETAPATKTEKPSSYGNIFAPSNLDSDAAAEQPKEEKKSYNSIFAPTNLGNN